MQRVTGLSEEQVLAYEAQAEAAMRAALASVMDKIARRIEANMPVLASALVAAEPPPDDGLPPGQPYISPDDLTSIPPLWQQAVQDQLVPIAAQVFLDAAMRTHASMVDASNISTLPSVGSLAAERYLAQARNTFEEVGDDLWATARTQLLDGFEQGESIPELAERLRQSANLTARRAVLVARTQVNEASNAGSFEVAQASGLQMKKEWIATPDLRTRPTHLAADGQRVDLSEPFIVGGFSAMFPAAPTLPPAERYNCRCTIGYVMPDRAPAQVRADDLQTQQLADLPGTTSPIDDLAAGQSARLQAIIDAQHARVEQVIEDVHQQFRETFPKLAAPGGPDLPAYGANPPGYVRPSLRQAKTPRQLRKVWQDEVESITGFPFVVDAMPRGISMFTAREYAEGTLQMFAQFPGARVDRIHWFDDPASSAYAHVRVGGHAIEFNMRYASESGRLRFIAARHRDVAGWDDPALGTSWSVRNDTTGQGVVYHEFTHILDIENGREAVHRQLVPLLIRHAQSENFTDIDDLIKRRISSYAASARGGMQELVAEAGTDVMVNGAAASQLSRDIFDLVRAEYRRRGFEIRTAPAVAEDLGQAFPKAAAPRALSTQTVAQLRALAKERGVSAPAGARKADLVRALEEAPGAPPTSVVVKARSTAAWSKLRGEAKAAARQADIDAATGYGDAAIRLDGLIANGASERALTHTIDGLARQYGVAAADVARLRALVGQPAELRAAMRQIAGREGVEVVGNTGDVVRFDRTLHESIGADIADGTPVQLVAPGARVHVGREVLTQHRARVQTTDLPFTEAGPVGPPVRIAKVTPGSTIGEVIRGPTQFEVALGESDLPPSIVRSSFKDRALRGADGVVISRGERLPAGFDSSLVAIRRGEFKVRPGLTAEESQALDQYVLSAVADPLNGALRAGRAAEGLVRVAGKDVDLSVVSARLDDAIAASELAEDTILYRGALMRPFDLGKLQPGAVTSESGFLSTTTDRLHAYEIIGWRGDKEGLRGRSPVLFEILAPKGTHGAVAHVAEREVLLGRGRSLRVIDITRPTQKGDVRKITFELLPEEPGRIAPVVRELAPPPPLSRAPLAIQQRQEALREAAARPVIKDEQVYGGESAFTRRLEHEGGPPTITKDTTRTGAGKAEAKRDADAEELGALVGDAVGLRAPTVIRIGPTKIEMEFLEEQDPMLRDLARFPRGTVFEETDDGRLMGLLDYLSGNPDRSVRNWRFLPDGRMAPIDMGDAFRGAKLAGTRDSFGRSLILDEGGKIRKVIDLNPADLVVVRARLEALRPEFERLGRGAWHRQVMARLAEVEKRADPNAAIRLAEARPDLAAVRKAARAKAATIAAQRANASLIARIDELVQAKASKAVIRQELDPALRQAEQLYAGADDALAQALQTAVDSGDATKIRAALTRQSKASGITPIGKAGAKAKFDPATMEAVGGTVIPDGADVIVVRRGARISGIETPEKAVVRLAPPPSTAKTVAKGDFTGLTRVSEPLGGNPGGIFEAGDGSRWYIKEASEGQAASEALALDLYRAAGLDAPEMIVGRGVEGLGRGQVATRFLDDAKVDLRARLADDPVYIAEVQDGFATDAWLANWDVVGANPAPGRGWDNIVSVNGHPVRIEAGGALRYRGLGAQKPFGDLVTEFDTLRDPAAAKRAAQIFESMTPEQIIASAERVRKVTPTKIKALVKKHNLDPELADTLIARRADILRRAELLAGPKPMTVREYNAAIKAAARDQKALDAAPINVEDPADFAAMPRSQRDALLRYRLGQDVNASLRDAAKFDLPPGPRYEADIRDIDAALDTSRLTRDVESWRGLYSGRSVFGPADTWGDDLAGFEWTDPAYSSITASERVAQRFVGEGGVRLRLLVSKGSRAVRLSDYPESGLGYSHGQEGELLLARGARFRIVRDRGWHSITDVFGEEKRFRDLDVQVIVPDKTPPLPWATK